MRAAMAEALEAAARDRAALQAQMDTFDRRKAETYQACSCRAYTAHVRAALEHVGDADGKRQPTRCLNEHVEESIVFEPR